MDEQFEIIQNPPLDEVLLHYGILGMHWGIRRFQNPDGTLTPAGLARAKRKAIQNDKIQEARAKRKAKREAKIQRKEQRADEKFKQNRQKILHDPRKLYKNLEKFDAKEIQDALSYFENKKKVNEYRRTKFTEAKKFVDTALTYGDTLNKTITFLNSNGGKGIRQMFGIATDDWWKFNSDNNQQNNSNRS